MLEKKYFSIRFPVLRAFRTPSHPNRERSASKGFKVPIVPTSYLLSIIYHLSSNFQSCKYILPTNSLLSIPYFLIRFSSLTREKNFPNWGVNFLWLN